MKNKILVTRLPASSSAVRCERNYDKCKGFAEGRIDNRAVCTNCLEVGERKLFKKWIK